MDGWCWWCWWGEWAWWWGVTLYNFFYADLFIKPPPQKKICHRLISTACLHLYYHGCNAPADRQLWGDASTVFNSAVTTSASHRPQTACKWRVCSSRQSFMSYTKLLIGTPVIRLWQLIGISIFGSYLSVSPCVYVCSFRALSRLNWLKWARHIWLEYVITSDEQISD